MNKAADNISPDLRWLEADGVRMRYRVSGDGQPIVLMHGWGCRADTLASIEQVALRAGCRVYNVDFPGFGESSEPPFTWGVEQYTDLIEKLIAKEKIDRPTLLGHSFGGRVGILYASRHPEVRRLVLVDAAGIKPRRSLSYYRKVYTFKAAKALAKLFLGKEAAQRRIDAMRSKRGSSDYAGASPVMRAILSKVVNEDLTDRLSLIKAPTLLIWGENDTATPLADARTMARLIPDNGLVSFPGCGHYSFLDNPGQFAAVLTSFLQS
ncbi:MAG: alpha/beta hydrolase [Candidatus Amulumruptor caecigallinarius]|nr:alpha/beta hydrolase [Candidatus Amulumruptor caecigallinarius]MCM1397821.1 alpha/beta hydrolase [Candidatus Amulumruptor caecigallinarius]MCM1453994.1 alpha/beta hydrolase [bacterium]